MKTIRWVFSTLGLLVSLGLFGTGCPAPAGREEDAAQREDSAVVDGAPAPDAQVSTDAFFVDAAPLPCGEASWYGVVSTRLSHFAILSTGFWGGFDLDHDPTTCAPQGLCADGVDNQLASLNVEVTYPELDIQLLNESFFSAILNSESAPEIWLWDTSDGVLLDSENAAGPFSLVLYRGVHHPDTICPEPTDVLDTESQCQYVVDPLSFVAGTCEPRNVIKGATYQDGVLSGGGDSQTINILYRLPQFEEVYGFMIHRAHVEAEMQVDGFAVSSSGYLGGVLCPNDVALLVSSFTGVTVEEILPELPEPDVEVGCGPDNPDGISAAFEYSTTSAEIVGVWEGEEP